MLDFMSHTYGRCRDCKRSKSLVKLSSRGRCPACSLGRMMANAGSMITAAQIANDRAAPTIPFQSAFASQERNLAD